MSNSGDKQRVLDLLQERYKSNGYYLSGSIILEFDIVLNFKSEYPTLTEDELLEKCRSIVEELRKENKVYTHTARYNNTAVYLPVSKRAELVKEFDLISQWHKQISKLQNKFMYTIDEEQELLNKDKEDALCYIMLW